MWRKCVKVHPIFCIMYFWVYGSSTFMIKFCFENSLMFFSLLLCGIRIAKTLIQELSNCFFASYFIDAMGLVYPQYWLQLDAEENFTKLDQRSLLLQEVIGSKRSHFSSHLVFGGFWVASQFFQVHYESKPGCNNGTSIFGEPFYKIVVLFINVSHFEALLPWIFQVGKDCNYASLGECWRWKNFFNFVFHEIKVEE